MVSEFVVGVIFTVGLFLLSTRIVSSIIIFLLASLSLSAVKAIGSFGKEQLYLGCFDFFKEINLEAIPYYALRQVIQAMIHVGDALLSYSLDLMKKHENIFVAANRDSGIKINLDISPESTKSILDSISKSTLSTAQSFLSPEPEANKAHKRNKSGPR